jgi:hypothetical protein
MIEFDSEGMGTTIVYATVVIPSYRFNMKTIARALEAVPLPRALRAREYQAEDERRDKCRRGFGTLEQASSLWPPEWGGSLVSYK